VLSPSGRVPACRELTLHKPLRGSNELERSMEWKPAQDEPYQWPFGSNSRAWNVQCRSLVNNTSTSWEDHSSNLKSAVVCLAGSTVGCALRQRMRQLRHRPARPLPPAQFQARKNAALMHQPYSGSFIQPLTHSSFRRHIIAIMYARRKIEPT
jgi:hypothetical protein